MSAMDLAPTHSSVVWRAALVLLLTLLAHAWLLQRVNRELTIGAAMPGVAEAIVARLLPPPPAAAPAPVEPKPPPRPVRVRPKPPLPPPTSVPRPEPSPPDRVDSPPTGPHDPAAAAEVPPVAEQAPVAEPAPVAEATAAEDEPPIAAGGEMLFLALGDLPVLREPVPMHVRYIYRTTHSELTIATASTVVDWQLEGSGRYLLRLTTTAVGITVLELTSEGRLQPFGLAPERYVEARVRRGAEAAEFDWQHRRITFSGRRRERPLADGTQDRVSFQIQLMLLGQAQPEWFRAGRQFVMWMAGRDDVLTYHFRSAGAERTGTGIGVLDAVRIERLVVPGEARIDVWLVPQLGWLPVRLRFTDRLGRVTESVLESVPVS